MNYTRGEWRVTPAGNVVVNGRLVARKPAPTDNDNEAIANAHLIAAAPDMYEALKSAVGYFESLTGTVQNSHLFTKALRTCDNALAKAEGKC